MKKNHLIVAGIALLMCLISAYFGVRIQNANANFLLTELNEIDQIYFADVEQVPSITYKAAVITTPFILAILILEIVIIRRSKIQKNINIALGLLVAVMGILIIDLITMFNPKMMDFSHWGYVWICLGLFVLVGNVLSVFIERFSKQ